tara:strand:- start:175 stop:306 length:132 start_codon:yes stop_codon:yes gene_type:complete
MLTIMKCRKVLCSNGVSYSDEEIEKIRDILYLIAEQELKNKLK